jgi:hypothetical protein
MFFLQSGAFLVANAGPERALKLIGHQIAAPLWLVLSPLSVHASKADTGVVWDSAELAIQFVGHGAARAAIPFT